MLLPLLRLTLHLSALACLCVPEALLAQDTLYFTDGTMAIGRVVNQSTTTINYKRADAPNGPTESARVGNLLAVKLSEGSEERFVAFDKTNPENGTSGQRSESGREPIYLEEGRNFTMGGVPVTRTEIALALANDSEAYGQFESGRKLRTVGYVLGGVGGFGLGYSIVQRIRLGASTRAANTLVIVGSVAVCTGGMLMESAGAKRMLRGINTYNKNARGVGYRLGVTPTGVGWVMTF